MAAIRKAYISAGSNLGDRSANLQFAVNSLAEKNSITAVSSCFETEPVGYRDQPWFLNLAIELSTRLSPTQLLTLCQSIEEACGRIRTFANAPRTLDLDILLYGNLIINQEGLAIPHPRMAERKFVLEPLAQIAPDEVHPSLKKTIKELLDSCIDSSIVRRWEKQEP